MTVFAGALSREQKEQLVVDVHSAVAAAAGFDAIGARTMHVWTFIHEVPEGNWAAGGRVVYHSQIKGLTTSGTNDDA